MADKVAGTSYSRISIGYSDSEDRLWVRLSGREDRVMFWLSRRMLKVFLRSTFDLMAGQGPRDAFSAEHRRVVGELDSVSGAQSTGDAGSDQPPRQLGLLHSIDLSANKRGLSLNFKGSSGAARFICDRARAHQLLQAFWNRQRKAGWDVESPWGAADPSPEESVSGAITPLLPEP